MSSGALGLFVLVLVPAFVLLALAMDRHHEDWFGVAPPPGRPRRWRLLALLLIAGCALAASLMPHPGLAWVELVCAASCAAFLVVAGVSRWRRR
ncbi:hypothetical protein CKO44_18725 [Rubrivivax gelatinosus]|uniref:DUF3325 domain-containing protein n=1 Tax=Rubrivivax gelatinosus TaxID=28068 RepID=A0ABS1E4P4_RUBGE|nr:DUF3325 family protein [Rubrivivax gelatinosus]MBK1615499.1 hypothetical protein [Rubrivivax gelatinosus]MBK1715907.1 hypothetical protein [Rubrivivax gelatinosus]